MGDLDRIQALERAVSDLKTQLTMSQNRGGIYTGIHHGIACEGGVFPLSSFFISGQLALNPQNKIMMELGTDAAWAQDQTGDSGPIGMSIGIGGEAISHYDYIPQGMTVTIGS